MRNKRMWALRNSRRSTTPQTKLFTVIVLEYIVIPTHQLDARKALVSPQDVLEMFNDVPVHARRRMWFQHDETVFHYARSLCDPLDPTFINNSIDSGCLIACPPPQITWFISFSLFSLECHEDHCVRHVTKLWNEPGLMLLLRFPKHRVSPKMFANPCRVCVMRLST